MDTTPLQKNAMRTQSNVNSETLKRKIEILDVLNEIYAEADEGIPNRRNAREVRPVPLGLPNATRITEWDLRDLQEDTDNGPLVHRS